MTTAAPQKTLSAPEFGRILVETMDLDPVYCLFAPEGLGSDARLARSWCLAYWMFYHAGVASRIAGSADFWAETQKALNDKWPRGAERRHFRGRASQKSVDWLSVRFPRPEMAVAELERSGRTFAEISRAVRAWPYFGHWIAFKVADMMERVLGIPVDFSGCALSFYEEPTAGASLIAKEQGLPEDPALVTDWLLSHLVGLKAPPFRDRRLNLQEAETVLCKYKSYRNGHYPPGKDSRELAHALKGWGPLAESMILLVPVQ